MLSLTQFGEAAVTVGVRVASLLLFTPFPGGAAVPPRIKAGLTLAITILLYPIVPRTTEGLPNVAGLVAGEMAVGLLLGLSVTIVFEAAQVAGQIAGMQVGFALVNIIDPQTQVDTPVLSTFHQLIVLLIFLQLNVDHWLLRGAANSFHYLPPGRVHLSGMAVTTLLHAAAGIWMAAVEIAAPILFATLLADVAMGFIGKASPQLQILFLGLSVKTILAIVVWTSALWLWPSRFESYFGRAISNSEQLLHLAR